MTDAQPSGSTRLVAALPLWAFWIVSALPFFVLFFEFHCGQIEACGNEWWYYARFYSHFFLYPITFGLFSTAFLHHPWIRTVHYLRSLPEPTRTRKIALIAASMLAVVLVVSLIEFYSKPSDSAFKECSNPTKFAGATPAPWSLAPDAMKDKDEGMRVHELLAKRCQRPLTPLSEKEKCDFQKKLSILWDDRTGSLSYTEIFYRVGFVAMTILFTILFATIFVVRAWDSQNRSDSENNRMMTLVSLALVFATFWILMRFTFLLEKLSVYPDDPLLIYNVFIFLVFPVAYIHHVVSRWSRAERYEKQLDLVLSIVSIAVPIMGFVVKYIPNTWISEAFIRIFGTRSSPWTYVAVLLLLLVVHFPHILRYLDEDRKHEDSDRPDMT